MRTERPSLTSWLLLRRFEAMVSCHCQRTMRLKGGIRCRCVPTLRASLEPIGGWAETLVVPTIVLRSPVVISPEERSFVPPLLRPCRLRLTLDREINNASKSEVSRHCHLKFGSMMPATVWPVCRSLSPFFKEMAVSITVRPSRFSPHRRGTQMLSLLVVPLLGIIWCRRIFLAILVPLPLLS